MSPAAHSAPVLEAAAGSVKLDSLPMTDVISGVLVLMSWPGGTLPRW